MLLFSLLKSGSESLDLCSQPGLVLAVAVQESWSIGRDLSSTAPPPHPTPPPLRLFKMLTCFDHFTPSIRFTYSRYEHSQRH